MRSGRMFACMVCFALWVGGCATRAENVSAAYVSPTLYEGFSCNQLSEEAQRISSRVQILTGAQNSKATRDAVATTAAVIIFWPAAFLVGGDDAQTAELAQLKGSIDVIQQMQIRKNCANPVIIQKPKA